MVKVVKRTDGGPELFGRIRGSKASLSPGGEFGGLDEVFGLFNGTQQRDKDLGFFISAFNFVSAFIPAF